ncbi:DNA primase [Miltoncostaea marina]|uniref:DNA primase n=1 Tax=Miltoncostaea marina TaxID=2843215 RepID=UPI001C3C8888|nr:DNA primase [Miltoncostaea marina]
MPLISPQSVESVRQGADLVELVRGRVELVRRGGRWWGRCPFHDERSPSFSLLPPDFRRYYCHGCHATGDAITWMREQEGAATFGEAVQALAERFGIPVTFEEESPEEAARRQVVDRRRKLLDRAAAFYAEYLWRADEAAAAREYLLGRGFEEALLRELRVGYSPGGGARLAQRALRQGFTREELVDAGLARRRGGNAADFFTSRIMFPIADGQGRVQGFGGRTLDPAQRAKYVNSPEGPNFRKRTLLFGLAEARGAAAREGFFVVVEGYTDVLGLRAAGVGSAVACMGTSLTTEQIRLLRRWAPEVRLCFDADAAGERAAWRSVEAAADVNLAWSAVPLPPGRDPGDLAVDADGRAALAEAVRSSQPLIRSLIAARVARAGESPRGREVALEEIAALLRRFPDSVEKDEGIRLTASLLRLSQGMEERLRRSSGEAPAAAAPAAVLPEREASPDEVRERRFLAMAVELPRAARPYVEGLPPEAFAEGAHRRAFELVRRGEIDLDAWPDELEDLAIALRIEMADGTPTEAELREAALRVELPMLERRAAELREAGDERERMRVLRLARKVRTALRGER